MRISDWSSDVCSSDLGPANTNSFEGDLYPITSQKRPDRSGNQNQTALRGKLVWTPTDNLKIRSEEHTSELQSLMRISYAVFCLKKKTRNKKQTANRNIQNNISS